jgi:DNA-binding XRE family transcriptional regulator
MAKGLSQGQLGEAMSVSRQTINSIERERYTPSLPLALALAGSVRRRWRRCSMRITRSKWFLPLFAVAGGGVVFVAQWIGCDPRAGLVSFAIVAGFGGLVLLGGRSETIRGLRGDGRDERFRQIDIHATAIAGLAVISAVLIASIVEPARGHNPDPYGWLAAIGGIAYLAAIVIFRFRG